MSHTIGNRRLISLIITATFFVASIFAYSGSASAITQFSNDKSYCQQVQSKLYEKTEQFKQKRQNHIDKYNQIAGIYSSVTTTLQNADYDAALLVELRPGLERRVANFSEVSQSFLNEMTDAGDSACRDKQSFMLELEEARTSLKEVQTSVADIQNYVQTIMIKTIKNTVEAGAN